MNKEELITPVITYNQWPDKSWTVTVIYDEAHKYVHTSKNLSALNRIVKERYQPAKFSK